MECRLKIIKGNTGYTRHTRVRIFIILKFVDVSCFFILSSKILVARIYQVIMSNMVDNDEMDFIKTWIMVQYIVIFHGKFLMKNI